MADVLNLFKICFQNLDISFYEWAIILFLTKIDPCVIGGSHFGWSFHKEVSFLVFVRGVLEAGDRLKSILLFKMEN